MAADLLSPNDERVATKYDATFSHKVLVFIFRC